MCCSCAEHNTAAVFQKTRAAVRLSVHRNCKPNIEILRSLGHGPVDKFTMFPVAASVAFFVVCHYQKHMSSKHKKRLTETVCGAG